MLLNLSNRCGEFRCGWCLRLLVACVVYTVMVSAQSTPSILQKADSNEVRLPDFSFAGYKNGLSEIPVVRKKLINVTRFGAIADDELDDSKAILEALDKAHSTKGFVAVVFPKGKFIVSEILRIKRSNIVLRGAGSGEGGTTLYFPRPLSMIDKGASVTELTEYITQYNKRQRVPNRNIDDLYSEYSWTGGFIWIQKEGTRAASYLEKYDLEIEVLADVKAGQAGNNTVIVEDASKLSVGDVLELQWFNKHGEQGALLNELYGDTKLKIGSHHWTKPERPLVRQKTEILAIEDNKVTISDLLLHNISSALPAQFAYWGHLTEVGIEDLHLEFPNALNFGHHHEQGYNGIYYTSVYNGWVRNLKVSNADSAMLTYNSANVTISDIKTTGDRRAHYAVHLGNVHNVLVEKLMIFNPVIHTLSFNTQSTKSVFTDVHAFTAPVLDQHAGSNHQNLYDDVKLYVTAQTNKQGKAYYPVWNGSGASYWQPGHGRYNTTWNLRVTVLGGAEVTEKVMLLGADEGPDGRIVGVSGNREFDIDYHPAPYTEKINQSLDEIPSLYRWQLEKRKKSFK